MQKNDKSHCGEALHGNSHYFGRTELYTVSPIEQLLMKNFTAPCHMCNTDKIPLLSSGFGFPF